MHPRAGVIYPLLVATILISVCTDRLFAQQTKISSQTITVSFDRDSLSAAFRKIQMVVRGDFAYDPSILPKNKFVTNLFNHATVQTVLDFLLFGTGLSYKETANALIIQRKKSLNYTIDGHITDSASGEELIGATIAVPGLDVVAASNQYGFYSLTLPEGNYDLVVSSIGYARSVKQVHLTKAVSVDHELSQQSLALNEVIIGQGSDSTAKWQVNKNLNTELLNRLPYYAGETDVVKALQMQTGIKAMTESGSGLFVRGGNIDQNLITLDEAMVYNPSHLFGLVSVFNNDAIKQVQLYNDHVPANYGGRLSSVLDIRMADGNNREFHVRGGVNLISLHLAAEGPIQPGKGSFLVTARRSLTDLLHQNFKILNSNSNYYDLNVKANYQLNDRDKLLYSLYFGNDHLVSRNSYNNRWGNVTSTLRWNHQFGSRLFFNLSAVYSNYTNLLDVNADTLSEKSHWKTGVEDLSLKGDFTFFKSPTSEIKFGLTSTSHQFVPGETTDQSTTFYNIPVDISRESAAYISHQQALGRKFRMNYGLRVSMFNNGEERRDVFDPDGNQVEAKEYADYVRIEPRINLSWLFLAGRRVYVTYNRLFQYLQLVQNNELTFSSLETWMPSSVTTRPQRSDYFSAGYEHTVGNIHGTLGVYRKLLHNQPELLDHAQVIRNPIIRGQLAYGNSRAFGAELIAAIQGDRMSADMGYSFGRVYKTIRGINNDQRFRANYDVPHEFKTSQSINLLRNITISSFFTVSSGRVATLPVGYYVQDGIKVPLFEGRNTSRFPSFHRWDLEARFKIESKKQNGTWSQVISAGVFNVYNRKNLLYYRIRQTNDEDRTLFDSTSGILPWVAYNFKF